MDINIIPEDGFKYTKQYALKYGYEKMPNVRSIPYTYAGRREEFFKMLLDEDITFEEYMKRL